MSDDDDSRITAGHSPGVFLIRHLPEDQGLLAAVGAVAIRHAHLDHSLIGALKTLLGLRMPEANQRYERRGSQQLREEVQKGAQTALGAGSQEYAKVADFLDRCESVSTRRHRFMHSIWYKDHYSDELGLFYKRATGPVPSVEELLALADEIESLSQEINSARQGGYIAAAMFTSKE